MGAEARTAQEQRISIHGHWSSRTAFVMAATGSAVGLGNIWKFPYIAGENGGGAFVILYLACVFAVGLPVLVSEVLLGRRGRRNPIATMRILGEEEGKSGSWRWVGVIGVIAGLVILSFYSVVAGWSLAYTVKSAFGALRGLGAAGSVELFTAFTGSWWQLILWHTVFMVMTVFVVAAGVQYGLERAVRTLMPLLFVLLVILVVYASQVGAFAEAWDYLFVADFGELTGESMLVALGHTFFTLSIGMGVAMAYGAYLPQSTQISGACLTVVLSDTLIAILAGLAIFPIVFGNDLNPAEGPGLAFEVLPVAFGQLAAGQFFGTLFFVALTFAAWTSSIGLLEPAVAWLVETYHRSRVEAAVLVGSVVWVLGLATVFSFNVLGDFTVWKGTLFANIDFLASYILLPLGALLITLFAGWVMCRNSSSEELGLGTGRLYQGWRLLARIVAPGGIVLIVLYATDILTPGSGPQG